MHRFIIDPIQSLLNHHGLKSLNEVLNDLVFFKEKNGEVKRRNGLRNDTIIQNVIYGKWPKEIN